MNVLVRVPNAARTLWLLVPPLLTAAMARSAAADDGPKSPAECLPATTLFYAELTNPAAFVSPIQLRLESLDVYKAAIDNEEFRNVQAVLPFIEARLGMRLDAAFAALTEGGVTIAFDPRTNGAVLLAKARDEQTLVGLKDALLQMARDDAKNKGKPEPAQEKDYRGHQVYSIKNGGFTTIGPWLLIASERGIATGVLDNIFEEQAKDTLSTNPRFLAARETRPKDAAGWAWVDVEKLRELTALQEKPFATRTDNPLAELLIGGLLDTLTKTPWMTATLTVREGETRLAVAMPQEQSWISETRGYFFGPEGRGTAPATPQVEGLLFSLSTYRDVAQMWLRGGDLFKEGITDKLAEADSNLSMFFGGKDFGETVLGSFEPRLQILAARQSFPEDKPRPEIRLPSFALILEMKEPEELQRELRRAFLSVVGFANVIAAMNGQPQLELDMPKAEGYDLVTATYIPEKDRDLAAARIYFNFSPSLAIAGKRLILSSTEELARGIATAPTAEPADTANTSLRLLIPVLGELLTDNHNQLVTQNMLTDGHTREEAETQIQALEAILGLFREVSLDLRTGDGQVILDLGIKVRPAK